MAEVIVLTGFMGSGKSTVGRLVADALGLLFVDLDAEIERREGRSIPRIFAEGSEADFRRVEGRVLEEVLAAADESGFVLALGGGTLTQVAARDALRGRARVVFLDTPVEVCWSRARHSQRPLATSEEDFRSLAAGRSTSYRETADITVSTEGLSRGQVAKRVLEAVKRG